MIYDNFRIRGCSCPCRQFSRHFHAPFPSSLTNFPPRCDCSPAHLETNKVFFAGKNIFPFNAKIESLDGKLQHDITELPVELEEFNELQEKFASLRTGDEHFVLLNHACDKLYGWGFNSHHQLAMIDSLRVLSQPDVFFTADDHEKIKLVECGKMSTCIVTGKESFNDGS